MQRLPTLTDDGLVTPTVGDWAEEKYRLIRCYAEIFSTAMKNTWDSRIYVDLFSGSGRARIRGTKRIIPAAPLLVTGVRFPFTRYVLCELDPNKIEALRQRLDRDSPTAEVRYVAGDSNETVGEITSFIPSPTRGKKVLAFCLADPYRLADLKFQTIARIATDHFVDFLVLIPSGMDASRNREVYLRGESSGLDAFLGRRDWRDAWAAAERAGQRFADFVADQFGVSMRRLGYKYDGSESAHLMVTTARRLPIYHLMMFSRHDLGGDFWEKCKAASKEQRRLF